MYQKVKHNPYRDVASVIPGLAIVVSDVLSTGVVTSAAHEDSYNGLDSVEAIGPRVHDVFDAIEGQRKLAKVVSQASEPMSTPPGVGV